MGVKAGIRQSHQHIFDPSFGVYGHSKALHKHADTFQSGTGCQAWSADRGAQLHVHTSYFI